ncbi:molybdate ABC transporter permease subunit [Thiomicrospira cyclica]|uniref:Molybdenum transport system permease n=1 Tax=Thiomicrospira cyclica (strain DSM 14477 / JCM 11371 / ALM1) TaxID=717773 RepID=F6DAU7_THICA|nr:molybdate ABC transporter permease subunit [Thiomicrospira cyclica]AEG31190.1 molybdate ABC transporter, inner membrane subunit [Thiomicrospira cyclica ALM1]
MEFMDFFAITPAELQALWLTFKLAFYTTVILVVFGAPLAWWLAFTESRWESLVSALIALPLVLPPTVLGFYLLIILGPYGWVGGTMEAMGLDHLAFSFTGILIGSVIFSLPFAIQPMREGFASMPRNPIHAAATLGAGPIDRFFTVILPLARGGFFTAIVISFAHTLGEFGVIAMMGGSIPGETKVVSIAIYDYTQGMDYAAAHRLSAILLILSFLILAVFYALNRRFMAPLKL